MLQLTIKGTEFYDSKNNMFINTKDQTLMLEHSLVSLSKWEFIHEKPFLTDENKTYEDMVSYIKCMTINPNIPDNVYLGVTMNDIKKVNEYINKKATATWFRELEGKGRPGPKRVMTSELIYYWMVSLRIPFIPCEKWHLNRVLTLIRVCNEKQNPKKQSKKDIYRSNAEINKARRERLNSKG